jgi:hypothetical protein
MQNLLSLPSLTEDDALVRMADWVELTALLNANRTASKEDLKKALLREPNPSENGTTQTRTSTDEYVETKVSDVFMELEDRILACGDSDPQKPSYPFVLDKTLSALKMRLNDVDSSNLLYLFLLAVTRSDMSSKVRVKEKVDPTKVFEQLCADVLRCFWGGPSRHSDAMVFGTAGNKSEGEKKFQTKVDKLSGMLMDGGGWKDGAQAPGGGDGKLDIVVWRRFKDERQGGLVGFAQCKTGDHWADHLTKLQPRAFVDKYLTTGLAVEPYRLYLVPCRVSRHRWREHTIGGGLLLDRCRIVQYSENIDAATQAACRKWLDATIASQHANKAKVTQ